MKLRFNKKTLLLAPLALALITTDAVAGNPDRAGSAGVGQLLINPWTRSGGLNGLNMASVTGIESVHLNVAGLAFVQKTELIFSTTSYLVGSDIKINAAGFGQKVGDSGTFGISVMSMSFGEIPITTVDLPEGNIGSFSPVYANIALSYAKEFSNSIYGGLTLRILSESISNVKAQGIAFDAGIRYVTGENDNLKFGIALKNVGPPMKYGGDGLSATAVIPSSGTALTIEQRSSNFELPSLVNIGFSYDFLLSETARLTTNAQFTSNSFTNDQIGVGVEFAFNEMFILRGAYTWEDGITDDTVRQTAFTGPGAGLTVQVPTGTNGTIIGLDYSYRTTNPFSGVHSIGLHITM